jgi:hypothetical protein
VKTISEEERRLLGECQTIFLEEYLDAATRADGEGTNTAVVKIMQRVDLTLDDDAGI